MTVHTLKATLMRGGTSKGLFFTADALPADPALSQALLIRAVGSPDPYAKQMDGLGTGISTTSKVVIVSKSSRPGHDIDYLFGHVSVTEAQIDWSSNCGNLSAAVGVFAIEQGLVTDIPHTGLARVVIWQANIEKTLVAHVPVVNSHVARSGSFVMDGIAFPGPAVTLDFLDPAGHAGVLPTGEASTWLDLPDASRIETTLIDAGTPAVIIAAQDVGLQGTELQPDLNQRTELLEKLEIIRAAGAVEMGMAKDIESARRQSPASPKLIYVAPPKHCLTADGKLLNADQFDLAARILSMGKLHHAFTGTGTVVMAAACAIPGTLPSRILGEPLHDTPLRFAHPSGINTIGATTEQRDGQLHIRQISMTRSARTLMRGEIDVPL